MSFREGLTPIFKLRAVLNGSGEYEAVVRDYGTGRMVASGHSFKFPDEALNKAEEKAVAFINLELFKSRYVVVEKGG